MPHLQCNKPHVVIFRKKNILTFTLVMFLRRAKMGKVRGSFVMSVTVWLF